CGPPEPNMTGSDYRDPRLTEQRNPRTERIDVASTLEIVDLLNGEDATVAGAVRAVRTELARAIDLVVDAFGRGGRLIYVGAGTSGRLGVLDASEIPPTFGASSELIQGIIAGGLTALHRSVEGAEDEEGSGALALDEREVRSADVVVGITASGRTPFVLGALARAQSLGARTILISCNPVSVAGMDDPGRPGSPTPATEKNVQVDLSIVLAVGPEILAGSTRLKAGTATK